MATEKKKPTDRQIKTRISRAVKAFEEKNWDRFKEVLNWLLENLNKTQLDQYRQEIITRLDKINPGDDARSFFYRGNAKKRLGKTVEATADFDAAIKIDPDNASTFNNRGTAKFELEDIEGAFDDFDEAIRLNPNYPEALNNRGNVKMTWGDYPSAILDFDEAIRLKPDYADAFNNRGNAKDELKKHLEAIADYDEALRLNPNYPEALNNRGIAKDDLGDHAGAIADFDQTIKLDPNSPFAFNNRGTAKRKRGDYAGAIADFYEALKRKSDYAEAIHNRAVTLAQMDAEKKAEKTREEMKAAYEAAYDKSLADLQKEQQDIRNQLSKEIEATKKEIEGAKKATIRSADRITDPAKIIKRYEAFARESGQRLNKLRRWSRYTLISLIFLLWIIWMAVYLGPANILDALFCDTDACSLLDKLNSSGSENEAWFTLAYSVSTTATTLLLISPVLYLLRRFHHDMRIERAAREDHRRKMTLLDLRLIRDEDGDKKTMKVMDHFDQHGTPEVLMNAYGGKSSARRDDRFIEKLAQRIADLLAKQSS